MCAQKLTKGQLSLAHGTATRNKEKLKQKPISSEETAEFHGHGDTCKGDSICPWSLIKEYTHVSTFDKAGMRSGDNRYSRKLGPILRFERPQ